MKRKFHPKTSLPQLRTPPDSLRSPLFVKAEAVRQYAGRLFLMLLPDGSGRARGRSWHVRPYNMRPSVGFLWPPGTIAKAACSALPLAPKDTMFPSIAV